jgi:hypothetical protein
MPHEHVQWGSDIKAVEREFNAMRLAADRLVEAVRADSSIIRDKQERRYLTLASDHLEGTYIVRLFAEFETVLRPSSG